MSKEPMVRKVNAQGLMDLIRANEEAPGFYLGRWFDGRSTAHPCGTYGCLVGNWALAAGVATKGAGEFGCTLVAGRYVSFGLMAELFSITLAESQFLFCDCDFHRDPWGQVRSVDDDDNPIVYGDYRNCTDREAAINRVRKFLYYKLRKWELLYEDDGRVKESARREEGDKHVCRGVLEACSA